VAEEPAPMPYGDRTFQVDFDTDDHLRGRGGSADDLAGVEVVPRVDAVEQRVDERRTDR
jgi:hypothetical protein